MSYFQTPDNKLQSYIRAADYTTAYSLLVSQSSIGSYETLEIPEGRVVGRLTGGNLAALTGANLATIVNSSLDHGMLAGRGDDDHTQYALTAGRTGEALIVQGNLGLGTSTFGTGLTGGFAIKNGAAGSGTLTDTVRVWASDLSAGHSALFVAGEEGTINVLGHHNGFGTASPAVKLHAYTSAASVVEMLRLENANSSTATIGSEIFFGGYYNLATIKSFGNPGAYTGGSLQLLTYKDDSTTNVGVVINRLGNVGVGTQDPSAPLDVEKAGTAKSTTTLLELTNTVNAADMDGTGTAILWRQWYYDAGTPAVANAAQIAAITETDWTATASTRDAYLAFATALDGTVAEKMRLSSGGNLGVGTTTVSARVHSLATTEQLRLGYDLTNYTAFTVGATGVLTIDPYGDNVIIDGRLTLNEKSDPSAPSGATAIYAYGGAAIAIYSSESLGGSVSSLVGYIKVRYNGTTLLVPAYSFPA